MRACLVLAVCSIAGLAPISFAADDVPITIAQQQAEKREIRERRTAYMNEIHRAAPGVDWRAIEVENRHAVFLERQALASSGRGTASWTELGSANQAGRTHVTGYSASTGALYVGSSLGGVWKGDLTGSSWMPISDGLGIGGHGLVVSPESPVVLTVFSGTTIYVSADDGATWATPTGLPVSVYGIMRLVTDGSLGNRVYALLRGNHWTGSDWELASFIFRSDDGGLTYERAHAFPLNPTMDMWIDRVDGGSLYVLNGSSLTRSDDEGDSFTTVGTIPESVSGVVLTGSEAGAPMLYAAVNGPSGWRIWRSTNAGATWSIRAVMGDWWGSAFCASIENPDLVMYAGVECWRSTNGGASFAKVNNWYDYYPDPANKLHADFPGRIECRMIGSQETFFLNTDGGTYTSIDGVATVQNISLEGLGISQYYTVFTSQTDPYLVVAGAQDQGYQQSDPASAPYLDFDQLISGDYAQATSTVRDHNWLYTVYPGFVLVQQNESAPQLLDLVDFPESSNHLWLPPIHADPVTPTIVYLGADHMWEVKRSGSSWLLSELPQDFTAAGGSYISAIGIAPSNSNYRYVAVNGGSMWYSHDGGTTWTPSGGGVTTGHYFHGHGITVSPTNPLTAWVSGAGYSGPGVYKTTDGGVTWTPMGDGLPSTMVFEIALDNPALQTLYAATEAGPFAFSAGTGAWSSILGTEAPLTTYWDVESVPELGVMRFGTYGRGIWDYTPGDVVGVESVPTAHVEVRLAPMPAQTRTLVSFTLDSPGDVAIEVFDLAGRRVIAPIAMDLEAGSHDVPVELAHHGRRLEAGMYFVRVVTPAGVAVTKLPVVR